MEYSIWSEGVLRFEPEPFKVWVEVDPEIARLARSLIPPYYGVSPGRYPPHISVVRNETFNYSEWLHEYYRDPNRGIASGIKSSQLPVFTQESVLFRYDPVVRSMEGSPYWWLRVHCPDMTRLRLDLGLPESSQWSRPPDNEEVFHCTVGNTKGSSV